MREMPAETSSTQEASPEAPTGRRRERLRTLILNVVTILFGVIIALLLLEVCLRVYNPFQARIKGNRIVLATNKTYRIKNNLIKGLDPEITVTRNSVGFRGPNPPADFGNHLTLVTVGGSTTQCFFLSDDQTWSARLGRRLEQSFGQVWVNNAGLDGHSTHGHLVLLEDFLIPMRPKVALFLVGANDVARSSIDEWDAENVKSGLQFHSPKALIKSLSAYSEVVALGLNAYRSFNAYQEGLIHQQLDLTKQGYLEVTEEAQRQYVELQGGSHLQGYEARLRRIVSLCREAGIEPVLVTQPLLAGAGTDDVTGVDLARVRAYGPRQTGKMYWDVVELYNDVTRRVGGENNLLVIDLARELPKTSRYFYDFIHYTPQGAEATAEIISRSLCPALQAKYPEYARQPCPAGS